MATNAVKYGALSEPDGSIKLEWKLDAGHAHFGWRERGGPEVAEPTVQGFGTRLFGAALSPHGGTIQRRFEREGLAYELLFPATESS
jgi:two-component sensor histidine kinase